MSAPCSGIDRRACIGMPPEHREHRALFHGFYFPRIHPEALVEAFVTIDSGIERPTTIGARSWLMKGVHIGHDAVIGADCELAPHCSVGGQVEIGDGVRVGQGALFRPFVKVGAGARIGMGAVVVKDVPAGETWVGNPARCLRALPTGVELTDGEELAWLEVAEEGERLREEYPWP